MLDIIEIQHFFPEQLRANSNFHKFMLKEYFHYKMLDIIFNSKWAEKISFIGGTNLRIVHKIERFSEDLDFDSFNLSREEFVNLTDNVIYRLQKQGINIIADDKGKDTKLKAFRRNLVFPELMYNLNLSEHKEQKFLIKIETEPHHFQYTPDKPIIQKFNVFTQINCTPIDILLSMKIGAVLERKKGRDYYDCIFLMGKTSPNWNYLSEKLNISSNNELKKRILESCENIDFNMKSKDFERMLFLPEENKKVKLFAEYIKQKDTLNK